MPKAFLPLAKPREVRTVWHFQTASYRLESRLVQSQASFEYEQYNLRCTCATRLYCLD